jgi:hypothetical protein
LIVRTGWQFKQDRLFLAELGNSASRSPGPRPWEVDDLASVTTDRVVVAADRANAWRLKELANAADDAAVVADRFARWHPAPSRFVIFLAEPEEWTSWYSADLPGWAGGWAVPVDAINTEVVVQNRYEGGDLVRQSDLRTLLVHELTHVTSLAGVRVTEASHWWLVEGIAEYATMIGQPVRDFDKLPAVRSFVRKGWDGDPAVDPPDEDTSNLEAAARYGIAFLAVRRLADRFGEERMITFFGKVVRDDESLDRAAEETFGTDWDSVRADCAKFVRGSAGLGSA